MLVLLQMQAFRYYKNKTENRISMKYFIGIIVLALIFTIGFWSGSTYASPEFPNQGVLINKGPDLEEVQQITGAYVRTHVAADFEECATMYTITIKNIKS